MCARACFSCARSRARVSPRCLRAFVREASLTLAVRLLPLFCATGAPPKPRAAGPQALVGFFNNGSTGKGIVYPEVKMRACG